MNTRMIHLEFLAEGGSLGLFEDQGGFFVSTDESTLWSLMNEEDAQDPKYYASERVRGPYPTLASAITELLDDHPSAFRLYLDKISLAALDLVVDQVPSDELSRALRRMPRSLDLPSDEVIAWFDEALLLPNFHRWLSQSELAQIPWIQSRVHRPARKPQKCPRCQKKEMATYLYGMPSKDPGPGWIIGGCGLVEDPPKWGCLACGFAVYGKKP
jgi:hypothetical protein